MILGSQLSRTQVERGIYEAIRKKVVAAGYIPDEAIVDTTAGDGGTAQWISMKETLRASLPDHKLIEMKGIGTSEARDELKVNTILVSRIGRVPSGGRGNFAPAFDYDADTEKYKKYVMPNASWDLMYEIRYFTDTAIYDRIIEDCIISALGDKKKLQGINPDGTEAGPFQLEYSQDVDLTGGKYFERLFRHIARDIWIEAPDLVASDISPMLDIQLGITPVLIIPDEPPA